MLFKSLKLGKLTLQNRVVMAPMCMFMARDGEPNSFHRTHYAVRSLGGVGMIIVEATSVAKNGYIMPSDLAIYWWKANARSSQASKSYKKAPKKRGVRTASSRKH